MFNPLDPNQSFIIIETKKEGISDYEFKVLCERINSVLYSKDFMVYSIKSFHLDKQEDCYLGLINSTDNDDLRKDTLNILNFLNLESCVIKYNSHKDPFKIFDSGKEIPLNFSIYESHENNKVYIFNGLSFGLREKVRYFYPKKKDHLKNGMVVEFFNNDTWNEKKITDIDVEFEKLYKLLIKYDKLRISMQN